MFLVVCTYSCILGSARVTALHSIDGRPADPADAARLLAVGNGLFETMHFDGNHLPLRHRHLSRLLSGLARLAIAKPAHLEPVLDSLLAQLPSACVVRLAVVAIEDQTAVVIQSRPLPAAQQAVSVGISQYNLLSEPELAGLKHLRRPVLEQVAIERDSRFEDDLLVCNGAGDVIEASYSNLFFKRNGRWFTPSLGDCGVAGVMRNVLLEEIFPALNIAVEVATISRHNLAEVTAAFLSNAVRGIWSVGRLCGRELTASDEFAALQRAVNANYPCLGNPCLKHFSSEISAPPSSSF